MLHRLLFVAIVGLGGVAFASNGELYVVSTTGGPDVDFTNLQTAIDAVPSGSTIVVRGGPHARPVVVAKSLVIDADNSGAPVQLNSGGGEIRNLEAGQRVVLRGFEWTGDESPGFLVSANLGQVWIEDCFLKAPWTVEP